MSFGDFFAFNDFGDKNVVVFMGLVDDFFDFDEARAD
jgi:hypothetical protein